jgi:hypothetical protein
MLQNVLLLPSLKLVSRDLFDPLPLLLILLNAASYTENVTFSAMVQKSGIIARYICRSRRKI